MKTSLSLVALLAAVPASAWKDEAEAIWYNNQIRNANQAAFAFANAKDQYKDQAQTTFNKQQAQDRNVAQTAFNTQAQLDRDEAVARFNTVRFEDQLNAQDTFQVERDLLRAQRTQAFAAKQIEELELAFAEFEVQAQNDAHYLADDDVTIANARARHDAKIANIARAAGLEVYGPYNKIRPAP